MTIGIDEESRHFTFRLSNVRHEGSTTPFAPAYCPDQIKIPPMTSFHSSSHTSTRWLLCLLLCVISWNGPLPLLHVHEAYSDGSALRQHLNKFHSGSDLKVLPGVHWHFAYMDELRGDLVGDAGNRRNPPLLVVAQENPKPADCRVDDLYYGLKCYPARLQRDRCDLSRIRSVPRSLLCDVPLVAITGVCLI